MCGFRSWRRLRQFKQKGARHLWDQPQSQEMARVSSGNLAFDQYVTEALAALERQREALMAEERAFSAFLEKLKQARDRAEFDRFMAERRTPQA